MEKRGYLAIFVLIVIGLMMGFGISAQFNNNAPWHALQQITNGAGTTSVDANNNDFIDRVDSIGENIISSNNIIISTGVVGVMPNALYNTWTLLPAGGVVVPPTADHVVLSYVVATTGNTPQQCSGISLEFTGDFNAANAPLTRISTYGTIDLGPYLTNQYGQIIVPIRKNNMGVNQGNFYFRYLMSPGGTGGIMAQAYPNLAQPCAYTLYYNGYID